ncbi:MAG: cell division protein FtsK, partial [Planctomycetes bacterium]|nr:cell division protein FtsK [Planctomycetota bacterium]
MGGPHMSQPENTGTISDHVRDLRTAIAVRAESESRMAEIYIDAVETHDEQSRQLVEAIKEKFAKRQAESHQVYEDSRDETNRLHETEYNAVSAAYRAAIQEIDRQREAASESVQSEMDDARWMVTSVLDDDSDDSPKRRLKAFKSQLSIIKKQLQSEFDDVRQSQQEVVDLLKRRGQWWDVEAVPPTSAEPPGNREDAADRFQSTADIVRQTLAKLKNRTLSRMMSGWNIIPLLLLIWGGLSGGLFFAVNPATVRVNLPQDPAVWGMLAAALACVPTLFIVVGMYSLNRSRSRSLSRELHSELHTLTAVLQKWRFFAKEELEGRYKSYKRWQREFAADRAKAFSRIDLLNTQKLDDNQRRATTARTETDADFTAKLEAIISRRDAEIAETDAHYAQTAALLASQRDREIAAVTAEQERIKAHRQTEEQRDCAATRDDWSAGLSRFAAVVERHTADCSQTSPDWEILAGDEFKLPSAIPKVIRFGHYDCDLSQLPDGEPRDHRFHIEPTRFDVPAVLRFPESGSLLYKTKGTGRAAAVESMRAVMLRFLTSLPAGKVRFTVIDPVGLGEAFSAFMHLDDYDDLMIGSRIWTEPAQIEKQLSQLSEHMENVFQAYLRNEFETIDEYNQQAGEVAEPYHLLVVANFPTNFTETAARRLTNIAGSGSRCGVYVLSSVDLTQPLPHKFRLADLEENATTLEWKKKRFVAADPELKDLPLALESPPSAELFTRIVHSAGRQSQHARKVEVPFSRVAPKEGKLWTQESSSGISIPLGRAGATKLQFLRLGDGTSQHVLIAGKTGSGKSSFLHALITNLALHYSPDQIEFFLIDFKKGVEFKTYATHELPHARVIGIESDREFGVSVIERLDGVLKERGDLFRAAGVQDLQSYRTAQPTQTMPRILLIIDEFQEFFTEDDALAQTAALLLDRLVRQGRAFGVHVLLGSQTLGGAYSLARSTLGQVAVRIALQCSEADAHLILSEENTAARLLTRPGEAIYNDANGLQEGNHPFQIAWLPDDEREECLKRIQARAQCDGLEIEPPIVFEGNVASDPRRNREITARIDAFPHVFASATNGSQTPYAELGIWLGESVSIKAPTKIGLQRHPGGNLLIVGKDAYAAFGL